MIYFTLPNFYYYNNVNNTLFVLSTRENSKLKNPNIMINSQSGSIPFQCWSGDINNNIGTGMFYQELVELRDTRQIDLRFNFANILLEDYDYYDNLGHAILKIFDDVGASIEISSIPFMEFLQEKYPYYNFVFSKQADIINPFTEKTIEILTEQECFQLIGLPDRMLSDIELLKKLPNKRQLELTVDPLCPFSCGNYANCMILEQQNQLRYSGRSVFESCPKYFFKYDNPQIISLEQIQDIYAPLGFCHFTFSTTYREINELSQLQFYIQYFFKEEYWNEISEKGLKVLNGESI